MWTDAGKFILSEGWYTRMLIDDVIIYQCEFDKSAYQDHLFAKLGVVFNPQLNRAVDKRKSEFLAGRYCCKTALAKIGIEHFTVLVGKDRAPQWPEGVKGAISHNTHHAMVVLTQAANVLGIGIDIESIMSDKTMHDIKDAIIGQAEYHLLDTPHISPAGALSLIFSIKESFFKAAYPSTGYYFDFDAVSVDTIDHHNKTFALTVNQDLNPKIRPGAQYSGRFDLVDEQVVSLLLL